MSGDDSEGDNEEQMLDYSVQYINVSSYSDKVTSPDDKEYLPGNSEFIFCFTELIMFM